MHGNSRNEKNSMSAGEYTPTVIASELFFCSDESIANKDL
jgi:hypothetical protein